MTRQPRKGFFNILLVWLIGMVLGVTAGAVTAMLLLPVSGADQTPNSIADMFRH